MPRSPQRLSKGCASLLAEEEERVRSSKETSAAGLARSLLHREGLLKPPGQRTLTSRHETEEKEQRFDEERSEEVSLEAEPPSSENEEGLDEEEPREEDEVLEGADLEELEPPEGSGHLGGSSEGGLELPTEELQPDKRPKEPSDKEVARAKQEHAERTRARKEQLEAFRKQGAEARKKQLEAATKQEPKAKKLHQREPLHPQVMQQQMPRRCLRRLRCRTFCAAVCLEVS